MFTHVAHWCELYWKLLGQDFEPNDYLFPYVSPNGVIHAKWPMTHDSAQDYINKFAQGARIDKFCIMGFEFTVNCASCCE